MVDREVVFHRLAALRENARRLRRLLDAGRERFSSDEDVFLKAERCLQVAIQAMLDIGTRLIADRGGARPAGYEDVIPALGRLGVVPPDLVAHLAGAAGLRNILVYDYLAVDHGRLYDELKAGLPDFEAFAFAIEAVARSAD